MSFSSFCKHIQVLHKQQIVYFNVPICVPCLHSLKDSKQWNHANNENKGRKAIALEYSSLNVDFA